MALTKERFDKHALRAADCPPGSWVVLQSAVHRLIDIESAATAPLLEQIAQLEQQLAEARKPDMHWNHDDAETPHDSIDEFLNEEICNGRIEVGTVFKILRATKQPSVTIKVTAIDEEQCEATYEVIDAAIARTQEQG